MARTSYTNVCNKNTNNNAFEKEEFSAPRYFQHLGIFFQSLQLTSAKHISETYGTHIKNN